eukprot:4791832-Lingulodinium_polyedra.AAC.1
MQDWRVRHEDDGRNITTEEQHEWERQVLAFFYSEQAAALAPPRRAAAKAKGKGHQQARGAKPERKNAFHLLKALDKFLHTFLGAGLAAFMADAPVPGPGSPLSGDYPPTL